MFLKYQNYHKSIPYHSASHVLNMHNLDLLIDTHHIIWITVAITIIFKSNSSIFTIYSCINMFNSHIILFLLIQNVDHE